MKKYVKKIIIILTIFVVCMVLFCFFIKDKSYEDSISYKGKKYIYLEYNMDIFNYNFNNSSNTYYEIDEIHPISHDKWDMIYFDGDLFVYEKEVNDAIKYYSNDDNYNFSFVLDDGDEERDFSIVVSDSELDYIYDMEDEKNKDLLLFEDIEKMGSIVKMSKDNTVYALITLAYHNKNWYWRSEIMNGDYEYVVMLPSSLNDKINKLIS